MVYWMGIDGGGSNLRVALTTDDLTLLAQVQGETANPSAIGYELASTRIRSAIRAVITQAALTPADITDVGIGIAGASATHSASWLREVVSAILPDVTVVLSSDAEIALLGALGERKGVLVLAGTGSVAFGVNASGQSLHVGGWGYLLGDEGSAYWIAKKALQALMRAADGRDVSLEDWGEQLLLTFGVHTETELALRLYHSDQPYTRQIAQLAPLVLEAAAEGVSMAVQIVENAAHELALLCRTVSYRLQMENPRIAFAGGLLENDNFLSDRLCRLLGLAERPIPLYPPVIGAVLLAQIRLKGRLDLC